jgi:hypothetical protein
MKKFAWLILMLAFLGGPVAAQTYEKIQGQCEQGGQTVTTDGRTSITKVQRSYPSCTITVYDTGTTNLASIASNSSGTPKSNPFTADSDGYWSWFALDGVYDVKMSGGGLLTPITRSGFWVVTSSGGGSGITGSGTTGRFPIFTSSSAIGNSVFQQVGTSEFAPAATGKRINLGTESQQVVEIANASVGGTVQNRLAILTGAPSTAVTAAITDTSKIVGIVIANAGTSGNAEIVQNGSVDCEFDGAATAGNYVGASTTLAGRCKDLGSSLPTTGVQVIGRVLETIGSAGNALVYTFTGEQHTSGLGGSGTTNYMSYWTSASTLAASNLLYDISGQILQSGYSFDIQNGGLSELTLETDQVIIKGGVNRATSAHVVQVKGVASQTGDYFKAIDSTSSTKFRIRSTGQPSFGGINYTFPALPVSTSCLQISSAGVISTVSCTSGGVRQAINIQQAPYSCVGDGVTDDTACFQSALDDAAAAGGKLVYAPAATYKVTGLSVEGGVTLEGDGKFKTIIYSVTNATILDLVTGVGDYAFLGPKIKDLWVKGNNTGSSQIGIKADDASAFRDVVIENVTISNAGSYGLYRGNVFSSEFRNIYSTGNSNYNFFILSPNMPSNYDYGHYSGDISAAAPAGYRVKQGTFTCWSCNGINTVAGSTGWWAVIGGKNGDIDGDTTAFYASASFVDCNIEGAKTAGILNYPGSLPSFKGLTTFVGLTASSGSYIAIDYDTDASLTPENSQRGYIEDTVIFSNAPASFYANSQPIHADGTPPVSVNGRGPKIAGAAFYDTFYNSATARTEKINRVDGYAPVVDITTSISYTAPGPRAFRVNCAAPCTLTLPSPNFYDQGNEIITVFNISATGVNVTLAANGGAAVNGSSYVMSIQGQAAQLYPDFTSLDWRVVGNRIGAGSTDYYPIFNSAHTITSTGSLIQNSSTNLLFGGTTLYGTDNTLNIGSSGDNRPQHIYVGTDVTSPKIYNASGGACYTSGSATPEASVTCEPGSIYLRTNGTWYIKASGSGNTGWSLVNTSGSAALTNTYVGYGASSVLAGTSDFIYATSTKTLTITNGSGASSIFLTGTSDTSKVNFGSGSVPGNQGGIVFPFVGGGMSTGPGVWWCGSASYASCSGLYINNGLTYQGTSSTHDHLKLAAATGTSSNGTVIWDWAPSSSLLTQTLSTSATGTAHVGNAITLTSTGTAAANFGWQQTVALENGAGTNTTVAATAIAHTWSVATAGSETGRVAISTNLAGAGVGEAFVVEGSQFYGTYATANITGAATINFNTGNSQQLTLTGNVTATTLTGLKSGGLYFIIFKMDGTGGWTLASTNIKVNGADLTITGTATTGRTLFTCMSDGTSLYCTKTLDIR